MPSVTMEMTEDDSISTPEPFFQGMEVDLSNIGDRRRSFIDRQRSCEVWTSRDLSPGPSSPRLTLKKLENIRTAKNIESTSLKKSAVNTPKGFSGFEPHSPHPMMEEARSGLRQSLVDYRGKPVGTIAALDTSDDALNYNQVFVRDFFPSALAFLMQNEPEIVKNFLLETLRLQSCEKRIDCFELGEGVMPASFRVHKNEASEKLIADFGESAIGRVAPVDSGFWWIILLSAYTKSTLDKSLSEMPECQKGMKLILTLCLSEGFDTFPTLLCADGCCMIDRRMGVYGYPIEIQALFFMALRCALLLLKQDDEGNRFMERIRKRLHALSYHMRSYFWLDFRQLNDIYRYKTEEYSHTAVNKFNVMPDSLPDWVFDFMPTNGGYFIGNVSPARMDFRWFCLGNCIAILSSLATPEQSAAIMDLIEARWDELVGEMPLKVVYPAIESHEWRITTGCDPKNTRWSYHNGGSWPGDDFLFSFYRRFTICMYLPDALARQLDIGHMSLVSFTVGVLRNFDVLLWLLTAACIKTARPHIAKRAVELAEKRLAMDGWPEYYDGKLGRYVGKQARKFQTWSIAGYLVAKLMLEDPSQARMIILEDDKNAKPILKRSASCKF